MNIELLKELQQIEYNTQLEFCPCCDSDIPVNKFKKFKCPECGEILLPCSLCDIEGCYNCPF